MRMQGIKAVCSNDYAREYFKNKGLSYRDITEGEILMLVMLLNREIKKSNRAQETSVDMRLSKKIIMKKRSNGSIVCCYLYMNSHYFTQRECISFNIDGFIGFAGWADQGNTNPILRAFLAWCDMVAENKNDPLTLEELANMDGQPVWITPSGFWALVYARAGQRTVLVSNDRDAVFADKEIELVGPVYRRPPKGAQT